MNASSEADGPSRGLTLLLAAAAGIVVANLYYAQPLVALIGPEIGLEPAAASLIVTVAQLGYAAALLLLVPLADRIENRRLIVGTVLAGVAALIATATSASAPVFFAAALLLGLCSVSVQMVVPLAAHLATPATRGRVVGNVMAGLLLGILLARPVASFTAHHLGWRAVFLSAAVLQIGLAVLLFRLLPERRPENAAPYSRLLFSLWTVFHDQPALRQRGFYQACLFAAFTLFWTTAPLHLAADFALDQQGIAFFALAGAAGALAAPVSGRIADRGWIVPASLGSFAGSALSFAAAGVAGASLAGLIAAAVALDAAVQFHHITAQRVVYALPPEIRGRVTALYMFCTFMGGAVGSAVASPIFTRFGWAGIAAAGTAFCLVPLVAYGIALSRERGS